MNTKIVYTNNKIINSLLCVLVSTSTLLYGMRKPQPTPSAFNIKQAKEQITLQEKERQKKEKKRQNAIENLLASSQNTIAMSAQSATQEKIVSPQQHVRYTPKTKKPFQTVSAFIPSEQNKLFIKTENNTTTSLWLSPFDVQNIDYLFEHNPQCTTVYVKMQSDDAKKNPPIFAVNKQPLLSSDLSDCFINTSNLQQETAQTTIFAKFNTKLTNSRPVTPRKNLSVVIKDITYFAHADSNNPENELVILKDTMYLKKYGSYGAMIQLDGLKKSDNGLKESDIDLIHTTYREQNRANIVTNEPAYFTLETNQGKHYNISYITHDNKTVSLGNPVQTITTAPNTSCNNHTLHIDHNNIVSIHDTDSQTISLVQCTKTQLNYIKNSSLPFLVELPNNECLYINEVQRNNCVYKLEPTTEFTMCYIRSQPTEYCERITIIAPYILACADNSSGLLTDDFSAIITVVLEEDVCITMPSLLNKSQVYEIATLFDQNKALEHIYFSIQSNRSYQKDSKYFMLERNVFEKAPLPKITSENLTQKEHQGVEEFIDTYINRLPEKPIVQKLPITTAIVNNSNESDTNPHIKTDTLESPELDQTSHYKRPLIIGGISVSIAAFLAFIMYHYSDTLYEFITPIPTNHPAQ